MDQLVEATIKHGLIPPVVMEFPGITAGGGFAGAGDESSSFKYRYFNEIVNSVEIVLGNEDIVIASKKHNQDLLHGISGAAKEYVKTTYYRLRSIPEAIEQIREETLSPELDYVDSILFSKQHGIVITGCLTDDIPATAHEQRFSNGHDPWYYLHVEEQTLTNVDPVEEYIRSTPVTYCRYGYARYAKLVSPHCILTFPKQKRTTRN
ncbi:hypothetical protein MMC19_003527 [Ptychographa xylographoides]|nr:hypothetical protein [Ptychographa xylographoides]